MATYKSDYWIGSNSNENWDFVGTGNQANYGNGAAGNDTLWGWNGNDTLDGAIGNDSLLGEAGADLLVGSGGNDTLLGHAADDDLWGGTGVDQLHGGTDGSADYFYFQTEDTGDLNVGGGQADTIHDFQSVDQIWLKGNYTFAGNTGAPGNGQYGIWQNAGDWVVTYNSPNDNIFHDIIVKGAAPVQADISFFT